MVQALTDRHAADRQAAIVGLTQWFDVARLEDLLKRIDDLLNRERLSPDQRRQVSTMLEFAAMIQQCLADQIEAAEQPKGRKEGKTVGLADTVDSSAL